MNVPQMFGENVFNDAVQKETLPKEVYRALRATIESGKQLDVSIAGSVAAAMKDWAVSKGATHYTHWFQPLTGLTAEKHDSFIEPDGDKVIMSLTGKSLIVGESERRARCTSPRCSCPTRAKLSIKRRRCCAR